MSLHIDAAALAGMRASHRLTPAAEILARNGAPVALAAWLAMHDFPAVQSRGEEGMTPLMLAALHGEDGVVAALLAEGAAAHALDDAGNSVLWYACVGGAPATILRLIAAGVDIDHANDDDITCLMQAASSGRVEVMRLLLSCGASEALYAPDGRNALDMAADRGFELLRTARRLNGADEDPHTADEAGPCAENDRAATTRQLVRRAA